MTERSASYDVPDHVARALSVPPDVLAAFCRRHRIRRLSVFGSALRGELRPDSDLDLLVEFEEDARVGLIAMAAMEIELGEMVGRKVDLRTAADLSRYFRDEVVREARAVHAA